jgi:hypothetical protein
MSVVRLTDRLGDGRSGDRRLISGDEDEGKKTERRGESRR